MKRPANDFDVLAAKLDNELKKVKALWGDDIVLGPDDYWRQLCDPTWYGSVPEKFLPYLARYQEMAISNVFQALKQTDVRESVK